jgi:hypothetical protein
MHGNHFWNGYDKSKGFMKELMIGGIPRFLIIDKEGRFIDAIAPRPSTPELRNLLNQFSELKTRIVPGNNSTL